MKFGGEILQVQYNRYEAPSTLANFQFTNGFTTRTANNDGTVSVLLRQCPAANIFGVTNTNDSGAGSLRQAIIDSNNTASVQTIAFQIPGAGVHTISPTSALPTISSER